MTTGYATALIHMAEKHNIRILHYINRVYTRITTYFAEKLVFLLQGGLWLNSTAKLSHRLHQYCHAPFESVDRYSLIGAVKERRKGHSRRHEDWAESKACWLAMELHVEGTVSVSG